VTTLTFDTETLGYMRVFEDATGVRPVDCIVAEGKIVILIDAKYVRLALGPHGEKAVMLKERMHREIQVVADSSDAEKLVLNVFYPFSPVGVTLTPHPGGGRHATVQVAEGWKARAIGKEGKHLKIARALLSRHSDIVSVSVA
jgi:N utilization substance protein A